MIRVACPNCQTKYRFDESQLRGRARASAKCKKCGGTIDVGVAEAQVAAVAATGEPRSDQDSTARVTRLRSDQRIAEETISGQKAADLLQLPPDKKYSLAVLQGRASGQIFEITKVRTTIGRSDADIVLDDPECSRQHATVEILGSRVVVTDLNSTNGTFVQGERIERTELENHHEFRIGEHVMMLIVTARE
ncbi:MAG TPA: FHA domain-containing protein [Vicinamibacteria bacterium]|nr:FHA domain-containing protein [Vicinamibacteria bacterium]